jgi:hypothetical protein
MQKPTKKGAKKKGREIIIKKAMQNAITALAYVPKTRCKMSKVQ